MYRQEIITVTAPIETKKQLRSAAKNRGITPDELSRQILLEGLNRIGGGIGSHLTYRHVGLELEGDAKRPNLWAVACMINLGGPARLLRRGTAAPRMGRRIKNVRPLA